MKAFIRGVTLLACAFALSNCAAINAAKSGDAGGALQAAKEAAEKKAAQLKDAVDRAAADCAKIEAKQVSWPEERAIGGAIAIGTGLASKQGLFVDITDKDPKPLKEKVDSSKKRESVKLSPGDKNDLNLYVELVGQNLAAGSSRPNIAWTFGVLDDPTVNAFSAPGGYVFVTTGMLQLIDNEAQLAAILGHEIAHVTQKHAVNSYQGGKVGACKVAVTGLNLVEAGASDIPGASEFVENAKFGKTFRKFGDPNFDLDSNTDPDVNTEFMVWFIDKVIAFHNLTGNAKEDEFDADRISFALMASAGYDTAEFGKIIAKIPGGPMNPFVFSHHPSNDDRIKALDQLKTDGTFGASGGKAPALPTTVKWPPKPAS